MEKLKISVKLNCRPKDVYLAWLSDNGHSALTGGKTAKTSQSEGGSFSVYDNYITGTNVEIIPYRRIIQKWRTADFGPNDEDSLLDLSFTFKDESTIITFTHTKIPENLGEPLRKFWKERYFFFMKRCMDKTVQLA